MLNSVDDSVKRFGGALKDILEQELKAGNKIVETYDANDGTFPMPNAIMIFLEKPFKTPIQKDLDKTLNIGTSMIRTTGKRSISIKRTCSSCVVSLIGRELSPCARGEFTTQIK
jgi:hypothetical protein